CAVTGRTAAVDEVETCQFTGVQVQKDNLRVSEVSGRAYRSDQERTSDLSGTTGHLSEFVECDYSGTWVLPAESVKSAVSGKLVRADWVVASEKDSSRRAARTETARCAVTDALLLTDEVGEWAVSRLVVDRTLLLASDLSGDLALASDLF